MKQLKQVTLRPSGDSAGAFTVYKTVNTTEPRLSATLSEAQVNALIARGYRVTIEPNR